MRWLLCLWVVTGLVGLAGCSSDDSNDSQPASSSPDRLAELSFTWTRVDDEGFPDGFDGFSPASSITGGGPGLVMLLAWGVV